jgi:hypothetical protein
MACFDEYDVVDLTNDEETYLTNLQPKQGPLSLYNSESKGDGEKRKPVCLVKLMRGVCTRQDCSFDHSREALLRGKQDVEERWSKELMANMAHLHYMQACPPSPDEEGNSDATGAEELNAFLGDESIDAD